MPELPKLPPCFKASNKTLKLTLKDGHTFMESVEKAYEWLHSQEVYNRVEFKFNSTYIVLAKLGAK